MSRYYDPAIGRFINADTIDYLSPETINGLNLYSYCGNDPVNFVDPSGKNFIYNNSSLNSEKLYSNKRYELLFSKFQFIDGGPYVNLDAKGWGKQGEFTTYQKAMYIVAGIGYVGILVSLGIGIFNMPLAISVFAFSTIVTIVSSVAGGFGGAT